MARLTKLAAVNRILRAASEQPVNTLLSDGTNDVSLAVSILDEMTIKCQATNLRVETTLQPGTDNRIIMDPDIIWIQTRDTDTNKVVERRGDYLFNLTDNTDEFTDTLKVTVSRERDFEDLPVLTQFEVADMAAREYQQRTIGDRTQDAYLAECAAQSRALSRQNTEQQVSRSWIQDPTSRGLTRRRYRDV